MDTPVINRFTIDLVTEERLSDRRREMIARELADNLHVVVTESEDQAHDEVNKFAVGHEHDTASGDRCPHCVELSLDYRSGTAVVEGEF